MASAFRAPVLAALLLAFAAPAASARGQLQVGTTLIEVPAGQSATHFTLLNTGDMPVSAQVRAYAWSQAGEEDKLTPSRGVVLSPPITTVPAGGQQVVRVVVSQPARPQRDDVYRVIVDELPGKDPRSGAINLRLRYVVPLYVRGAEAAQPNLQCRVDAGVLVCLNSGGRSAQLSATRLAGSAGEYALSPGLFGYVLPGASRRWTLESARLARVGAPLRIETHLNGQPATIPLATSR